MKKATTDIKALARWVPRSKSAARTSAIGPEPPSRKKELKSKENKPRSGKSLVYPLPVPEER